MAYHIHSFAETVENMEFVASSDEELTVDERNLLSAAYKNVIDARRESWRNVSSVEQEEEFKGNEVQVSMIEGYREKIEMQLQMICQDIVEVLGRTFKLSLQRPRVSRRCSTSRCECAYLALRSVLTLPFI